MGVAFIFRRGVQRALDHVSHLPIRYRSRATSTIFVVQPFNAVLRKPPTPLADRVLVYAKAFGNLLALQALRAQQNHPASIRQRTRCLVPPNLSLSENYARPRSRQPNRLAGLPWYNSLQLLRQKYTMTLTSVPR